jgi:hypothetical protein
VTDPVAPKYALPAVPAPVPLEQPYKRDLMLSTHDISGAQPSVYLKWPTREDHAGVADIAGAAPRARTRSFRHAHVDANVDVRDINSDVWRGRNRAFVSQRRTDPQRLAVTVHGRVVADDDAGMFPAAAPRAAQHPDFSLTTADIEGAQAAADKEPVVGGIRPADRRDYRVTNFIGDIQGTSPGSRRKGLTTLRGTDPLERDYVLLDGRQLDAAELTVGKSWYNAAATLLAAEAAVGHATMLTGASTLGAGVAPAEEYAKRVLDPRDAELARLRGEAAVLRKERDLLAMSGALATARAGKADGALSILRGEGSARAGSGAGASADYFSARGADAPSPAQPPPAAEGAGAGAGAPAIPSLTLSDTAASGMAALEHAEPEFEVASAASRALGAQAAASTRLNASLGRAGSTAYASTLQSAALKAATVAADMDAVMSLRAHAAPPSVKNTIGIIPGTRPVQRDAAEAGAVASLGATATLRAASMKFDRSLDAAPAVARPTVSLAASSAKLVAARQATSVARASESYAVSVARLESRARAAEVSAVRDLPTFKQK